MRRRQLLRLAGAGVLAAPTILWAAPAPDPVDVELILAVDASRSIDAEEHEMQMRGYAAAFRDSTVIQAISRGEIGAIACRIFTWSDSDSQEDLVPWMRIDGAETASRFADALDAAPRRTWSYTSISGAMEYALGLYGQGFEGTRRVLDISGDGMNNSGRRVEGVRQRMIEAGVIMNGLAVVDRAPGPGNADTTLENYYREEVIGGPGSFLVVAEGFESFEQAVRRKIAREIASLPQLEGSRFAALPQVERIRAA
jgi:hypothetical protein